MSETEYLKEVKKLSNGKFGKDIVIAGDAQIVLVNLMKIYTLTTNRLASRESRPKTSQELRDLIRREVVKHQYGTVGELTDALVSSVELNVYGLQSQLKENKEKK